jgi:hypothetical protein
MQTLDSSKRFNVVMQSQIRIYHWLYLMKRIQQSRVNNKASLILSDLEIPSITGLMLVWMGVMDLPLLQSIFCHGTSLLKLNL